VTNILNYPLLFLVVSLVILWLSGSFGTWFRARRKLHDDDARKDFDVVLTSTVTLLSLIIGFTFSMAIGRYDQRKNYEEEEANAIGTEYVRLDMLPAPDAAKTKDLLVKYLNLRIKFYQSRDWTEIQQINADTAQLQNQLWSSLKAPAAAQPNPVTALSVAGMNDVLNRQGYTQAAWWNRIPTAAWILLVIIAIFACALMGFSVRGAKPTLAIVVLPLTISISFFLIADIDSPRSGMIRVVPQNLISLSQSLHGN
jgi:hypothetical protein